MTLIEVWFTTSKTWAQETLAMHKRLKDASQIMALLVLLSSVFVGAYGAVLALISTDLVNALIGGQRTGALHADLTDATWKLIVVTTVFCIALFFSRTLKGVTFELFSRLKWLIFLISTAIVASFAAWPILFLLFLVLWVGVTAEKSRVRLVISLSIIAVVLLLIYGLSVEVTYHAVSVGEFVGWSGALLAFGFGSMEVLHR
jgi:hypothetical protein